MDHKQLALDFLQHVNKAGTELAKRLQLSTYLNNAYQSDSEAKTIIDRMDLGAEKKVRNIPQPNRMKTGSADTQYGSIIIEFENDLAKTGKKAVEQLIEYAVGNWNSGDRKQFTLIASDCITWRIYAPRFVELPPKKKLSLSDLALDLVEEFKLTSDKAEDLFFFLDRHLFRTQPQQATLENIQLDFGEKSALFRTCFAELKSYYSEVHDHPQVKTACQEWEKFLSLAYGNFEGTGDVFLIHTYLSVFSKVIAYTVLVLHKE